MKKVILLWLFFLCFLGTGWAEPSLEMGTGIFSYQIKKKDLEAGCFDYPGFNHLTVNSTEPWALYLYTDNPQFAATGDNYKPVGDLLWRLKDGGAYLPLTNFQQPVAQGAAGGTQVKVEYRMLVSWLDPPDTYTVTLVYILTTQGAQ